VKDRLKRIGKWAGYPLFYVFCLTLFGYLTFPFDLLKDRIIAEFEKQSRGQRLEIGKMSSYWFSGVEMENVRLVIPPDDSPAAMPAGFPGASSDASPPKDTVVVLDEVHARVRLLPLFIGRVRVDFWASAFGGEISGTAPVGKAGGDIELELSSVNMGKIEPLAQAVGLPLRGTANGKLELDAPDGKYDKMNGSLDLTITDLVVGDGKTKIQGLIALPAARAGTLTVAAEAKDGTLKITKLSADGADLQLVGDGKVSLKEPWNASVADLYARFKFTDAYRGKNDTTKSLLGDPKKPNMPSLIELQAPMMKKAKRSDGFYGLHVHGPLRRLKYDPSSADGGSGSTPTGRSRRGGADSPFATQKGPNAPLIPPTNAMGTHTSEVEPVEPPPPPQPRRTFLPEPTPPGTGDPVREEPQVIQRAPAEAEPPVQVEPPAQIEQPQQGNSPAPRPEPPTE